MEKENNKEYSINNLLSEIDFNKNILKKINSQLILTEYQISILKRYHIPFESAKSYNQLIYFINNALAETEDEELEIVLDEISEKNYYQNTKK
ncbi:MAG: hypothetical protein GX265_00125 [Mollicutes bacterium]|nr:hypothetical protein [Mollicutes bacterium]